MKNFLCKIGIHKWKASRGLVLYDMFPSPFDARYKTPTRKCTKCGKKQQWLPGYGGSEAGCWV